MDLHIPPPSCSEVTAPDCLISSRGIGDIRTNPVPTPPESRRPGISRDEEQWDSTDQPVWRRDRTRGRHTVDELLGANTFSQSVGDPDIEQMARDMSDKEILKMELDQLKKEVSTPRTAVNANCADTIAFVEGLLPNDPLIKGVPDDKNPYKGDKGGCIIT